MHNFFVLSNHAEFVYSFIDCPKDMPRTDRMRLSHQRWNEAQGTAVGRELKEMAKQCPKTNPATATLDPEEYKQFVAVKCRKITEMVCCVCIAYGTILRNLASLFDLL
jgi:hypothetical protein